MVGWLFFPVGWELVEHVLGICLVGWQGRQKNAGEHFESAPKTGTRHLKALPVKSASEVEALASTESRVTWKWPKRPGGCTRPLFVTMACPKTPEAQPIGCQTEMGLEPNNAYEERVCIFHSPAWILWCPDMFIFFFFFCVHQREREEGPT